MTSFACGFNYRFWSFEWTGGVMIMISRWICDCVDIQITSFTCGFNYRFCNNYDFKVNL